MLSVIMPYVNEWPQIAFTIRAVAEELKDIEFEIIAIDNYCAQVQKQNYLPDKGHDGLPCQKIDGQKKQISHIKTVAQKHSWLKYIKYDDKLSHWNAKNKGVKEAAGDILLFLDSHIMPSRNLLTSMYHFYNFKLKTNKKKLFSLHAPLAYHILENKRLIYAMENEIEKGIFHYRFCTCKEPEKTPFAKNIFEVPCMSTCGMMISKKLYDKIGGWPDSLGIYGGGENFINFTMAVMGIKKFIFNRCGILYHHGDKRNYSWNYNDYHSNRLIATYLFGGEKQAKKYVKNIKGNEDIIQAIYDNAITKNKKQREMIKKRQVVDIENWHWLKK